MKSFHHFGDSYATVKYYDDNKHFCHHIADSLGYSYCFNGLGGLSNELIFNRILSNLGSMVDGDILFINFSYLVRGCYYDRKNKEIKSTNTLYNEMYKNKIFNQSKYKNQLIEDGIIDLLNYYLDNALDYNVRLFTLMDSMFKYLIEKGINIFYIFVEEFDWSNELLNYGINISFKDGFGNWLIKNNFHNEEDIHYTVGIQPMLADLILRKTNNLSIESIKKINIEINDVDFTKIQKPIKLL